MNNQEESGSLEYARRLFSNILDWYKNADTKAQVVLTFDGVFLSFLTSLVFLKKEELRDILSVFGSETWIALVLMALSLIVSIISALMCMKSRLAFPDIDKKKPYKPEVMWFFGSIAFLEENAFQERIKTMVKEDEITVLSSQIYKVSKNVLRKHQWANRGFLGTGLSLLFFIIVDASFLTRFS